jgi:hypothetical protein
MTYTRELKARGYQYFNNYLNEIDYRNKEGSKEEREWGYTD